MKKKFKLFTTIASLCLAIALMGFGVYAATQVTVTVTSNVSYSTGDNLAFVLKGGSAASATEAATTANKTLHTQAVGDAGTTGTATLDDVVFTTENQYAVYTFEVKNNITDAGRTLTVTPTFTAPGGTTASGAASGTAIDVAPGATETFTVYFKINDLNVSMESTPVSFSLAFANKA